MTQEQFDRERRYCTAMAIARELADAGILLARELRHYETILAKKYLPAIGRFVRENP